MICRIEATLTLTQSIAVDQNLLVCRHNRTEYTQATKKGGIVDHDLRNVEASSFSQNLVCRLVEWRAPRQQGTIVIIMKTHNGALQREVLAALVCSGVERITVVTDKTTYSQYSISLIMSLLNSNALS